MGLFLCLFGILLGWYYQKSVVKSWGFRKKIKRGMAKQEGLSVEGRFKPSAHYEQGGWHQVSEPMA